ncbi:MAG: transglycosylase domain-containing protein [Deltaproteobacteria bacterium]|nr:transglycosylase domain-containing protein [Deltaproteobacteria bacterium]
MQYSSGPTTGGPQGVPARATVPVQRGGTRVKPRRRRLWLIIPLVTVVVLAAAVVIGLLVVYPKVGRWMIRDKLGTRLATKLGRDVRLGAIDVSLGHATIRDVEIRGPLDGDIPLVHIDRIEVEFDTVASLVGRVELGEVLVDGVVVTIRRDADGRDNVRDIIDRLRKPPEGEGGESGGGRRLMPSAVKVTKIKMLVDDAQGGATMLVADGDATWKIGEIVAEARGVKATTIAAPRASVQKIGIKKTTGKPPVITMEGGEIAASESMALSGIAGSIVPNADQVGQYTIDLTGGYGGVPGKLWTAKGGLDTAAQTAKLDLEAERFKLERIAAVLESTPVVDYKSTTIDTKLHLEVDRNGAKFAGALNIAGLNIGHWRLADKEVHDVNLAANVAGSFDRGAGRLELTKGDFVMRDLPFSVTGTIERPPHGLVAEAPPPPPEPGKSVGTPVAPQLGPMGVKTVDVHLVIPPADCQRVLDAFPPEMVPYMVGYKMQGTFDTNIRLGIDFANLDALVLDGRVGINGCKVVQQPKDGPKRLKDEFKHHVEVETGRWISFDVGPSNEQFVPFADISPYLVKSVMSTEDSNFYYHHGFIVSEFRTALVNNLKQRAFRQGASSITMQLVKNVLLYREKTLARKLQELFLTWHVENTLKKERILEIYFNVIEYGPGIFGIGPAAEAYFGKVAAKITPNEAAFFSSILPRPRPSYQQYCQNRLWPQSEVKIASILKIMKQRDRLTKDEYDEAIAQSPLVSFAKDDTESEDECMKRTHKIMKNAPSTNPLHSNGSKRDRERDRKK